MKKWVFPLLLLGVSAGTLFVNIFGIDTVKASTVFSNEYFSRINSVTPDMKAMMRYVAGARLKELSIMLLLMMTPFSKIVMRLMVPIWGFINGMLASICVIQQGITGFLLFLAMSVPAFVIFYPGAFFLCRSMAASRGRNVAYCVLFGVLLTLCCSVFETYFFVNVIKKLSYNL